MKKKNLIKGGIVVAIIGGILAFMGDGWFGAGNGTGDGDGEVDGNTNVQVTDPNATIPNKPQEEPAAVVDVLIDGTSYLVLQSDKQRKEVALADLVKQIETAKGNADGIKARIGRKDSATLTVERELGEAIREAKIPDSAVHWIHDPVK